MLHAMYGNNWSECICCLVYCCHDFHCMGLLKLDSSVHRFWELCTCLVPHCESTDSDKDDANIFWLLMN